MNKKAFTLVELLAVILILGIIALIAISVLTGIINDSKNSSTKLSVKNYVSAINDNILSARLRDEIIVDGSYKILSNGNLCLGVYTNSTCNGEILNLNLKTGIPTSGTVVINDRKVTSVINANINGELISYDAVRNEEFVPGESSILEFSITRLSDTIKFDFVVPSPSTTTLTCEYGSTDDLGFDGIINKAKTSCTLKKLKPNSTYYYKITLTNANGDSDTKEGTVVTLPTGAPTISIYPDEYSTSKTVTITYSDDDIANPKYYFYTTSEATSDISVVNCGTGANPSACGNNGTTSLLANTWYKLGSSDDTVELTYLVKSSVIARVDNGDKTVGTSQALVTTIDNNKPVVAVDEIVNASTIKIALTDNQSGIKYFAVTQDNTVPTVTNNTVVTSGSDLNKWYTVEETTNKKVVTFNGIDDGDYYIWGKDVLGNYDKILFSISLKEDDVITITPVVNTYTSNPIYPTVTTKSGASTTTTYYSDDTCTTEVTPTNVGEYYAIVTTSVNEQYKRATSSCTKAVTIQPAVLTATATCDSSKVYDSTRNANCTIGLTSAQGNDNITATGTCLYDDANIGGNKTISCTDLLLSGANSNNYILQSYTVTTNGNINNAVITFNPGEGTLSGTSPMYARKGESGVFSGIRNSSNGGVPIATKTGYTFAGWYSGNSKIIGVSEAKVAATSSDTHKGIVYLDPTNLNRICNASNTASNVNNNGTPTGITSGCMKFYIFDDSGDTYKMILDHNTSGNVAWNSNGSNSSMNEVAARLAEDTTGWVGNPRLITADEIAHIVGVDTALNWDSTVSDPDDDWFYFDGAGATLAEWQNASNSYASFATTLNKSRYAWLYDNTGNCEQEGCNIEDNNTYPYGTKNSTDLEYIYGYWTSTAAANSYGQAWRVDEGAIYGLGAQYDSLYGVRPVITLSKGLVDKSIIEPSVTGWTDANGAWLITEDKTLTAVFNPIIYKISYNANGGSNAPALQAYTYSSNETILLSSSVPIRSGYDFMGWSLSSSATTASYSAGDTWDRDNIPLSGNTWELYAVWVPELVISEPVITGTTAVGSGSITSEGYLVGTTVTFTCTGSAGNYPTTLQITGENPVVNTNNSSSITATMTLTQPTTTRSVSAICTGELGNTKSIITDSFLVYRKFQLTFEQNGAASIGETELVRYLPTNTTSSLGLIELPSITCTTRGLGCTVSGWDLEATKTGTPKYPKQSQGQARVTIQYSDATGNSSVINAKNGYEASTTLYAITYFKLYNPLKTANITSTANSTSDATYIYIYNTATTAAYTSNCTSSKRYLVGTKNGRNTTICSSITTNGCNASATTKYTTQYQSYSCKSSG